ncbi:MAG: tetratricopeptide repeat protein, partial [Pseudomonadota bacterium]
MRTTWLLLALFVSGGGGCAATKLTSKTGVQGQQHETKKITQIQLEPIKLKASSVGGKTHIEVFDAHSLFETGSQFLSSNAFRKAIDSYDKILTNFPNSRFVVASLYNAGLAHEAIGEFEKATERYKKIIQKFKNSRDAVDAGFRLGGCYAELQKWKESSDVFDALLYRNDLTVEDRVEAFARKGLAQFQMNDTQAARTTFRRASQYHSGLSISEQLDRDFYLAMVQFYLAAIPHRVFRELKVVAGPDLGNKLDEKARLLLVAQAGYIRTIKEKNPYWAAAAGFQVGSLYREFYNVLMTSVPDFDGKARENAEKARIPIEQALADLKQVYLEEVHKKVKPLLNKAIRVFEQNLVMAQRVGVQS